jgi:hypothetical protein
MAAPVARYLRRRHELPDVDVACFTKHFAHEAQTLVLLTFRQDARLALVQESRAATNARRVGRAATT